VIGLDTNVLVRYVLADDPAQYELAATLISTLDESDKGFVSLVALVEMSWVLSRGYDISRSRIGEVIKELVEAQELILEQEDLVRRAVAKLDQGADFADAVIAELGADAGCRETVTFDRRASARAGMRLLTD
jgi:predicted nucleic-acid-binding protein